jgi:gliding motility-associated-like protein
MPVLIPIPLYLRPLRKINNKINTNSDGWDGTFNGNPLPSDDYWYTAKLQDGRETKGHFSLKMMT